MDYQKILLKAWQKMELFVHLIGYLNIKTNYPELDRIIPGSFAGIKFLNRVKI